MKHAQCIYDIPRIVEHKQEDNTLEHGGMYDNYSYLYCATDCGCMYMYCTMENEKKDLSG